MKVVVVMLLVVLVLVLGKEEVVLVVMIVVEEKGRNSELLTFALKYNEVFFTIHPPADISIV